MIFRLSHKLATKIKVGRPASLPREADTFADWSSRLFVADRTQYILLSNTETLFSTMIHGRGIADEDRFIARALGTLREAMEDDGLEAVYHRHVAPGTGLIRFAGASDRSVTGSMSELIAQAKSLLAGGELSPFEAGLRLNDVLLSAIVAGGMARYATPRGAFRSLSTSVESDGT